MMPRVVQRIADRFRALFWGRSVEQLKAEIGAKDKVITDLEKKLSRSRVYCGPGRNRAHRPPQSMPAKTEAVE